MGSNSGHRRICGTVETEMCERRQVSDEEGCSGWLGYKQREADDTGISWSLLLRGPARMIQLLLERFEAPKGATKTEGHCNLY